MRWHRRYLDAKGGGYDVVLDYLWGRPTEILLRSLVSESFRVPEADPACVQVGERLAAPGSLSPRESLRTSGVEIYGAAKGLGPETMREV